MLILAVKSCVIVKNLLKGVFSAVRRLGGSFEAGFMARFLPVAAVLLILLGANYLLIINSFFANHKGILGGPDILFIASFIKA